jgi:hypothetical protein
MAKKYVIHTNLHGPSEHPMVGFQSHNATNPNSEGQTNNNPEGHSIEDDILENTILVVCEVVCTIGPISMQLH